MTNVSAVICTKGRPDLIGQAVSVEVDAADARPY